MNKNTTFTRGLPQPLGATRSHRFINFAIFCPDAKEISLLLFDEKNSWSKKIALNPKINKTGNVWHIGVDGIDSEVCYAYTIEKAANASLASVENLKILDPFAKAIAYNFPYTAKVPKATQFFDWENDTFPSHPLSHLIIYEMHIKGFTQHPSSLVKSCGTFQGVIEKIGHLVDLGINAVEFLPIHSFRKDDAILINPDTHEKLQNYWGYSTINYFSLENSYATNPLDAFSAIVEFKQLVKELHKNKIEVILDVVFNHTAEGNEFGPSFCFKILSKETYYIISSPNTYNDYTGCGNSLNANHPVVVDLILQALRYWVVEMHVDGFRFDLASEFYRGCNGEILDLPFIVEAISKDPLLANTKLIAEPWDAVGLYQVGRFYPQSPRWSEWNGKYRDSVRQFIKGTGFKEDFATRICGSQDLYGNQTPQSSINFITAHDGFTLKDLVSYNHKHNLANGEANRDGDSFNNSWNCGQEGHSDDETILSLRKRQIRNFHLALMISQGIPMILMGDEYGHTKYGNNNTWNQNNSLNWFLWDELEREKNFYKFYKGLIHFRKNHTLFHKDHFLTDQDVEWHGVKLFNPKWNSSPNFIALTMKDKKNGKDLYIAFNAHHQNVEVELPTSTDDADWLWIVNTSIDSPNDFTSPEENCKVTENTYTMLAYSSLMIMKCKKPIIRN